MLDSRSLISVLYFSFSLTAVGGAAAQEVFDDLPLRSIGPAIMGGRIDSVAVVPSRPGTMFIGTASGGLWRTVNLGTTWTPVFDDYETSSIGDVAVAPSDPDIVWVGTGEPNNRNSSTLGHGVYLSEDGGTTFRNVGLEDTAHIGKVIVDPSRPSRVFVAAVGNLWKASEERGVFLTNDGGRTWDKVLYVDEDTGVTALAMDPINPDILYAAAYQRRRTPWGFSGGGPGSGLYKTTNGGESWSKLDNGLPDGMLGRMGIAISATDPRVVYILVEHGSEGGVYRSEDRGVSWDKVNDLNPRPMYYSKIFVDPSDSNRVYVLGSSFHSSANGGRDFETHREMTPTYDVGVHGDHHALWIDPTNGRHLVLGGDGGLYISWDRARSFRKIDNVPLGQFYAIAVDMDRPYNIYGGAQDTHSWMGPSSTRHQIGILNGDWVQTNFGDGMYQQADPTDARIAYTESQGGNLVRLDRVTGDRKVIKPVPEEDASRYRFHWTSPFVISRHDAQTLYFGGNRLFITKDRGASWTASPDLTRAEDRSELSIMGSVPDENTLSRNDGVAAWGTITSVSESPTEKGTLYVGTDDGRLQLTRDGGETWESLEGAVTGFDPLRAKVSRVLASHAAPGRAYVTFDRHHLGDPAPYVFTTDDFGRSFTPIDVPAAAQWVNVIVEHPQRHDLLFLGGETGLFFTLDRGESWQRVKGGLPTVPVDDLVIHPRDDDLVVGTHGRSIYILDDLTPLVRVRAQADEAQLFQPREATIFLPWKHESYGGQAQFSGENRTFGALISYYLPSTSSEEGGTTEIRIRGADGSVLRTLKGPSEKGFHRISWDLRRRPAEGVARARGPLAPTGTYTVEMDGDGAPLTTSFEVVLDPRAAVSGTEFRSRYDFLVEIDTLREALQTAVDRSEGLASRATSLSEVLTGEEYAEVRQALDRFSQDVEAQARSLGGGRPSFRNPTLLARASRMFSELSGNDATQGSLHPPSEMQRRQLGMLSAEARSGMDGLDAAVERSVREVNELLAALGPFRLAE